MRSLSLVAGMDRTFGTHTELACSVPLMPGRFKLCASRPPRDLLDIVSTFWELQPKDQTRFLPTQMFPSLSGRIRFVIHDQAAETLVYGPSSSSERKGLYFADARSFGATLTPLGLSRLFGAHAPDLCSSRVKGSVMAARLFDDVEERVAVATSFEERKAILISFLRSVRQSGSCGGLLDAAIAMLRVQDSANAVDEVSSVLGVSRRTLHRHFLQHLGVRPKAAARILRIQRSLKAVVGAALPTASTHTFADQSHFIREFKDMIGVTPGQFGLSLPDLADADLPIWQGLNPSTYDQGYPDFRLYR